MPFQIWLAPFLMRWKIFFVNALHRVSMNYECITLKWFSAKISHNFRLCAIITSFWFLFSAAKKNLAFACLLSFPIGKVRCLWRLIVDSLSCIIISYLALSPCANRKNLNQLHFGNLSMSATISVSVELTVTTTSFFDTLIIAPFPIVKNIPECPFPSTCVECTPFMHVTTSHSSSIDIIKGANPVAHAYPVRYLNFE